MNLSYQLLRITRLKYSSVSSNCLKATVIPHQNYSTARLVEVGKFDVPKLSGKYETGQLFLHRVFGYRGIILFPWIANVYDRDGPNKTISPYLWPPYSGTGEPPVDGTAASTDGDDAVTTFKPSAQDERGDPTYGDAIPPFHEDLAIDESVPFLESADHYMNQLNKDFIRGSAHTYYQVLIDNRDCKYLKLTKKAQTEAVTFLGHQDNGRTLYAVPGLDYVAHEDIMPYSVTEMEGRPIHHELFTKFLQKVPGKDPPYESRETLRAWQERNHHWLELSDVHKETTENIRVTVIPFYMGCREAHSSQSSDVYWWRYCIRLENLGEAAVQLRERHWRIFSLSGTLETVRGRGVVGSEPILSTQDPAFQYSSHVSLQSPSGHMWGTFRMERQDGNMFECRIPPFSLESKQGEAMPSSPSVD